MVFMEAMVTIGLPLWAWLIHFLYLNIKSNDLWQLLTVNIIKVLKYCNSEY